MNGLHELPLIIFTVLAQSVVGATLVLSLAKNEIKQKNSKLFILLVLMGAGFIASIMHLGSPLRAFNSLNRIGESMLSNEIAGGSIFFAILGLYWLLSIFGKMPENLSKIWLFITAFLGLVFMYMMNNVYHISTVPTWNTAFTSWSFYLTVVTAGFTLGYALFQQPEWIRKVIVFGLLLIIIVIIYQGVELATIHSSVQNALNLVPDYTILSVIRVCLLAIGGYLLFRSNLSLFAAIFIIAGEMIGRTLFYALHMTIGTAVAG